MAYWYGGSLSLLYSFQINRIRSIVLLVGMYFFYLHAIEGMHYMLHKKTENAGTVAEKKGKWVFMYQKSSFWITWGILMLAWLVHLILRYPGAMSYDNWAQLR